MILSKPDLKKIKYKLFGFDQDPTLSEVSYELTLNNKIKQYRTKFEKNEYEQFVNFSLFEKENGSFNCRNKEMENFYVDDKYYNFGEVIELKSKECILGCTREIVSIPKDLMGWVQTKGRIARGFVSIHASDSQIAPNFHGRITLEIVNLGEHTRYLKVGDEICSLFLEQLSSSVVKGYNGSFNEKLEPTTFFE